MLVKEIMTPKVESVEPGLFLKAAAEKMRDMNVGALPVWDGGKVIGMITDRDICCRVVADGRDPRTTKVRDIMSKDISCCFDDQDCDEAAHLMGDKHIRRLAVLNRDKAMVGMLSVDDLARCSHVLVGDVLKATARPAH